MKPARARGHAVARLLLGSAVLLPLARVALATAPAVAPAVDAGLLEFLGSVDSEEPGWHDFLAGGNARNASRPPPAALPPSPPVPPPAPAPPARKVKDT